VIPLPSADTGTGSEPAELVDEARTALLEAVTSELGDAVVDTHLIPGRDLWVRVANGAWTDTADYLRDRQRFRFFDWLSAVDWMPSPHGRSLDAAIDLAAGDEIDGDDTDGDDVDGDDQGAVLATGHSGGDTRFQVVARVYSLTTKIGITVKTDVDDELTVGTWTGVYPGASWHEREAWEMFGIRFSGHPGLRNLYLPGDFEGHPMRKDFALLARLVKPWPGIVDVEPMPDPREGGA
jgi:NADH-quinone oxidoreductase subunit C